MSHEIGTAELRALFRQASAAVKAGTFGTKELEDLFARGRELASTEARVSVLRFALRLAERSGWKRPDIVGSLRDAYANEAAKATGTEIVRSKLRNWERRYCGPASKWVLRDDEHRTRFPGSVGQLADRIAEGDWDFWLNRTASALECSNGEELLWAPIEGRWSPFIGNVSGQVRKAFFDIQHGLWHCAGKTDIGVPNGDHNDDAIAACEGEGRGCLLAIADGTGDSRFGARASMVALGGLVDAWCAGVSIDRAVKLAASKLRADNCAHELDGACTLSACVLCEDHAELVAVGDAFFICLSADGQVHRSVYDKERRSVLGGEPLGCTITSSGRLVENLQFGSKVEIVRVDDPRRVALGSDGACTPGLNESLEELSRILGTPGDPLEIAEAMVARAEHSSQVQNAYDNISAVIALRDE